MNSNRLSIRSLAILVILLFFPINVYAYLDPGTGSAIIQALVAGVFGLALTLKVYWHRFIGIFKKKASDSNEEDKEDKDENNE